jgi:hypothetical protein
MEFIAPSKNNKSNNQRITSPMSITNMDNNNIPKGFLDLTVETNGPTMADQKAKVLSHLKEVCTGKEEYRPNRCFGKYYKNYEIKHLQIKDYIAELFRLNTKLFMMAHITPYSEETSIEEQTKTLDKIKTQEKNNTEKGNKPDNTKSLQETEKLIVLLAEIYTDPVKQYMLLELSQKKPNSYPDPKKYVLIESDDYFLSAQKGRDEPLIIDTNTEISAMLARNPFSKKNISCKQNSNKLTGKKRTIINSAINTTEGGKKNRITKKNNRKRNKTKKVKRTNRKNSRYIKRK